MSEELLKEIRYVWVAFFCLIFLVMTVIGCSGGSSDSRDSGSSGESSSTSDNGLTWKDRFPGLWSTAYAQDGVEPEPEDVTYGEFLAAVVSALKSDAEFLAQIQGPQGEPGEFTQEDVDALDARIIDLETKLASVSVGEVNGYSALTFSGVNVHIVSGSGSTSGYGSVNGLGNLIVGYNELRGSGDDRTGSHNIVVGAENNYSVYGGLIAGFHNSINGVYSSISGGSENIANGFFSSVSGGYRNGANGNYSSISGGVECRADGESSSVNGGTSNDATGERSNVSGGSGNEASGLSSSISGGSHNIASGNNSSVSGGSDRSVTENYNWRAGDLFQDN